MSSFNRITLIGTISNDPDARVTNSGEPMLKFSLATERPAMEGLPVSVDYIPIVAWRQVAERKDGLVKGCVVLVDGRISTRSYDDSDGKRKWTTEVEAKEIRPLAGRFDNVNPVPDIPAKPAGRLERVSQDEISLADFDFGAPKSSSGFAAGPKFDVDLDEDVPF